MYLPTVFTQCSNSFHGFRVPVNKSTSRPYKVAAWCRRTVTVRRGCKSRCQEHQKGQRSKPNAQEVIKIFGTLRGLERQNCERVRDYFLRARDSHSRAPLAAANELETGRGSNRNPARLRPRVDGVYARRLRFH